MKKYRKPYYKRKLFKNKKGGAKFMPGGIVGSRIYEPPPQASLLEMLQRLGHLIRAGGDRKIAGD